MNKYALHGLSGMRHIHGQGEWTDKERVESLVFVRLCSSIFLPSGETPFEGYPFKPL